MSVAAGPSIVTSDLVLDLDAGNTKSYPGSGTAWTDLSGNRNNGTLTNGPTFDSGNGGNIVFNGSNQLISIGNNSSLQVTIGTICAWFKTSAPGSGFRGIIVKQSAWGLFTLDGVLASYDWGAGQTRTTNVNVANGLWNNVAMSFTETVGTPSNNANIYLNGINVLTTTIKNSNQNVELQLAAGGGGGQNLNGSISVGLVYNRVLSAEEIV